MTYFIFACVALLCWSGSDLFSKMGTSQKDSNSQWRVMTAVGLIMGLHAVITIIASIWIPEIPVDPATGELAPEWWRPLIYTDFKAIDFVRYLPVAFIYILAMLIGYRGLRYIELSVSSPICNSSGSLALVICVLCGWAVLDGWTIAAVVLITAGIIMLGMVEYRESDEAKLARQDKSQFKYTKSIWAILIPVIYLILDALGTVGDQAISEFELFGMSEYASNTAFEFTSLCYAIFSIIWIKFVKKDKLFIKPEAGDKTLVCRYLGGACETIGQIFYMSVMFSDFDAGMPMISAYCVVSVIWSRIFLKEKLSRKHYIAIGLTIAGIILLGIFSSI